MRNSTTCSSLLVVAALFALNSAIAQAPPEQSRLAVQTTLDFSSKYVWRGIPVNPEPVLQAGVDAVQPMGNGQFGIGWWGNFDLTETNRRNRISEHNFRAAYAQKLDLPIDSMLEVGAILYYFPHEKTNKGNTEYFALGDFGLLASRELDLNAVVAAYYDDHQAESWYCNAGLRGQFPINNVWSGAFHASVGWGAKHYNAYYYANDIGIDSRKNAMNDAKVEVSVSAPIDSNLRLRISAAYSDIIDSDLKRVIDRTEGVRSENFWFAVGLHAVF